MRNFLTNTILCLLVLFATSTYAGNGKPFDNIVFFGDSLSDNGNMYKKSLHLIPKSPPYFKGRFSNGPVWSDIVAQNYSSKKITFRNDALGGETVVLRSPTSGFLPFSFEMAINDYRFATAFQDRSKTLFIIWLGANDYLQGDSKPLPTTTEVVNTLIADIQYLIDLGGTNFIVFNLPEIAKTPFGLESKPDLQSNFRSLVMMHNLRLSAELTELQKQNPKVNIHLFNIHRLFTKLLDSPNTQTPFKNTTQACWPGTINGQVAEREIYDFNKQLQEKLSYQRNTLQARTFDTRGYSEMVMTTPALKEAYRVGKAAEAGIEPCANPDDYVFWDSVHPTAVTHKILAEEITRFIDENYTKKVNS